MFLSMISKEFKHFFRSKGNVVLLFIFPIILITTLSVGLKEIMEGGSLFGSGDEYSKVYYSVEEGTHYEEGFNQFVNGVEDSVNIEFEKVASLEDVKDKVDNYDAIAHVTVDKDGFVLYSSDKGEKIKTKIFKNIFESILNNYAIYGTIAEYNPQAMANLVQNKYDEYVEKESVGDARNVTASEYYTFAELALIILFIAGVVGESVYKENQLTTINRIRLSKIKEGQLIASKVLVGTLITFLQTLLVYVYSTLALDVNWGDNTLKFMLLFIAFGFFASMLGAIIGLVAKKDTTVSGVLTSVNIAIGFFGGCYTPLHMIISIPVVDKLMYLSPIYWINTAISSMLCGIDSNVYTIALLIPVAISALLLIFYFIVLRNKGGLAND